MHSRENEGCANNPIVVLLGVIAAIITIYVFITGHQSLSPSSISNTTSVGTGNVPNVQVTAPVAFIPSTLVPPTTAPPIIVLITVAPATSTPVPLSSNLTQRIVAPSGLFVNLWQRYSTDLGSALPGNESDRLFTGAEMPFQNGHMFSATFPHKRIWVVMGGGAGVWTGIGTWREYRDTWQNGDPDFSCPKEADYPRQPIRGFGRVWCNNPEVRKALGWGVSQEIWPDDIAPGKGIQRYQEFEHGFIFRDSDGWTNNMAYVFFSNGTFVRQPY